jgi:hypothetical protein
VQQPAIFKQGNIVALVKEGPTRRAAAVSSVEKISGNVLTLKEPLTNAKKDDVVAVVRFFANTEITAVNPLTIKDPATLRVGDVVAKIGTAAIQCAEVKTNNAGVVELHGEKLDLAPGDSLGVVSVRTITTVADTTDSSITIEQDIAKSVRPGWYAAYVDRWIDTSSDPLTADHFPDGTLPGDAVGYAALTTVHPLLYFAHDAPVKKLMALTIDGADMRTREGQRFNAAIKELQENGVKKATLDAVPSGIALRPEKLSVIKAFTGDLVDNFAAYAQERGLSISWLGCQIPQPTPTEPCPGLPDSGPCSCH